MGDEDRPLLSVAAPDAPLLQAPIYDSLCTRDSYEESGILYVIL